MNPEEFIERLNRKEEVAYEELFRHYYRYLVVFAVRMVEREDVAEDVVQEVFIALWEGNTRFNSYHGFQSFLYSAVKNGCLNHLKREQLEERYEQEVLKEHGAEEEMDEGEEYALAREELYRRLHEAIEKLPKRCKEVIQLRMKGLKNEQIAEQLNVTLDTVKTQNKKGLRFLREELGKLYKVLIMLGMIPL